MKRTNPLSNSQQREADEARRAQAQARAPLIAKWDPNIPPGFIHVDDAIEYIHRRWGNMIRAEHYEAFSRDATGPQWTVFGDWPDKSRGQRYYKFDDIDLWVWRTVSGLPASWMETHDKRSVVPVLEVSEEYHRKWLERTRGLTHAKEPSDGRTGIKKDGRRGH